MQYFFQNFRGNFTAASASTGREASHRASLQVQDALRWILILSLLAAAGLKLAGIL